MNGNAAPTGGPIPGGDDGLDRMIDELHATVRSVAAGMPAVYGLSAFGVPQRAVGEWALTDGLAQRIALLYGQFDGDGPLVLVHTARGPADLLVDRVRYGDRDRPTAGPAETEDELPRLRRSEAFAGQPDLVLPLAGRAVAFAHRRSGRAWYASASVEPGLAVLVEAVGVEPDALDLVPVDDLTPYLDGHRALLQRHH